MSGEVLARLEVAKRRLLNVLRDNVVATARTLEQKISDAGPGHMRVDPHALLNARKQLEDGGTSPGTWKPAHPGSISVRPPPTLSSPG